MLRRSDVTVLIRPDQSWPVWSSLVLHGALFAFCCTLPYAPKVHDCIMVDLQMPSFATLAPMGGRPAPGPKSAATRKAAAPGPAAHQEPSPLATPLPRPQAIATPVQKQAAAQPPPPSPANQGTATEGTARGQQTGAAPSHGGGGAGGTAQGSGGSSSGSSGSGSGGSGGPGKPFEGEFGAQGGPTYLSRVLPVYPRFARRLGKEGTVLLRLTLDESGTLKGVELLEKAGHGFDEAALTAVKASRFRPALRHGRPVPCRALLPVRFELRD